MREDAPSHWLHIAASCIGFLRKRWPRSGLDLEFEVTDQEGRAIAQERFDAVVTIGENTYGGSINAESRRLTEYWVKDLPDSKNGCTVKVLPARSCF